MDPLTRDQLADTLAEMIFTDPVKRGFARGVFGVLSQVVDDSMLAVVNEFFEDLQSQAQPGDTAAIGRSVRDRAGRRELIGAILSYVRGH